MLKTRFRSLRGELPEDIRNVPRTVIACCILHNICMGIMTNLIPVTTVMMMMMTMMIIIITRMQEDIVQEKLFVDSFNKPVLAMLKFKKMPYIIFGLCQDIPTLTHNLGPSENIMSTTSLQITFPS